ncbi:dipeptidyl aminopeptidase/acylaminoacyl peptidase [Terriglobus roseus DSM 18391]|uniref:Acyl-peptide hydrolase n=1 Tax=Terriglobus roseus (strain DSM 18391 / NRRL B-41598 / KBS 63) TaxID=926566 RepID=I3ZMF2_TERRK|nr:prolyl oligopeptidase family serine peptidase [Terriglobus roseus]AFL90420.1 dipeptidyl aminopeptidase/acylaminoacyl peptidase [Terriglobus roseus DSM 18391]
MLKAHHSLESPVMRLHRLLALSLSLAPGLISTAAPAQKPQPFTVADALSAPFMNQLTAAPAKNRVAWFVDQEGIRNVWVASPGEKAHAITHYNQDDGQDIDDITWSPDGERVAYTRGTGPEGSEHPTAANPAHLQEDVQARVEIASVGGDVRIVGEGHSPVFSTDGKRIFFLRSGRIFAADVMNGTKQPEAIVIAKGTATALRPSPDGAKLAFVSRRGDHSFIGVFTFAGKTLTYADPGTGHDHDPVWSNDSKRIAFVRESPWITELDLRWMRSVPVPWSIRIANAATGEGTEAWHADKGTGSLFHEMVAKNQLLWMADGRIVFPWEKTGWLHLYSLMPGEQGPKLLTPGDFEVDNVVTDGERIVYSSNQVTTDQNDIDRKHLWSVTTSRNQPAAITKGETIETNPALMSDGSIAHMQASVHGPFLPQIGERVLVEQLTSRFPGSQFGTPDMVVFPASDGLPIHGQWFLPKNAKPGDKLPTIVFFHGGSRRQMLLGFNPMQYYAQTYELNQYFVSRGYAVLSVNYRSGTGYGMEFRQAPNYGAFGGTEYLDIEGAVKWLKAQPNVDTRRIGAWGGSYGGYLTALALARDSADFAAGVDLHGVHDWSYELDLWKPTDDPDHNTAAAAAVAFKASPMADVSKWKSPVLLMQGDDDRNVLFGQTVRLAAALRANGVEVEEKIFPDEVHDFLLHKNWVKAYELAADFFDRKLKNR